METVLGSLKYVGWVAAAIVIVLVVLFVVSRVARLYHKVPPSQVLVVYGRKSKRKDGVSSGVKLVTGGGTLIWPFLEEFMTLDLTVMTIEQPKDQVYTIDGIPLALDWTALVQIGSDENSLATAARAFLGKNRTEIEKVITQTLSTNNRAIVGQMTVEELHRDRDAFVQKVRILAKDEMLNMGLSVKQMGVRDITDGEGYFQAMAAPKIAAIKRDAKIAEAEADREARVKAAEAKRAAEQAEFDAKTKIIEQTEAFQLREVAQTRTVQLSKAKSDQDVQAEIALAVKQEQEATILAPARAQKEAAQIVDEANKIQAVIAAEADKEVKLTQAEATAQALIRTAEGEATSKVTRATADAEAVERQGNAEATKIKALKYAEAEGTRMTLTAQAEGTKAQGLAAAESTKAQLLAEAEGKKQIADATAAQGEINLRQAIAEMVLNADVEKAKAVAAVMAGIGDNVRIVQFSGNEDKGQNALLDLLKNIPEVVTMINAKTEALTGGQGIEEVLKRVASVLSNTAEKTE